MKMLRAFFSRKGSKGDATLAEAAVSSTVARGGRRLTTDNLEYEPPVTVSEKMTNLVYQDHSGGKGGSDSASKLRAIKLPELKGKRFLDLGCNAGFFCAYAAKNGASYVLGVDSSDKVIAIAKERNPSIDFRGGGWDKYPEGEFDVVICLSAIHYAKDAVALARNIHSSLSPDGVFVLEGGLVGAAGDVWTDTLIPVWRQVGDKCRHLSRGFAERHLLLGYEWSVIGESIKQGGDPVKRFVVHARPSADPSLSARPAHRICPLEFAAALALSASTIADEQASCRYVRKLGEVPITPSRLADIFSNDDDYELFVCDILYALNNHRACVKLRPSAGDAFTAKLQSSLEAAGVSVTQGQFGGKGGSL